MNIGSKRLFVLAAAFGLAALSLTACTEPPPAPKPTGSYSQPAADNDDAHWLLNGLLIGQMMGGNNHTTVVEHRYPSRAVYRPAPVKVQARQTAYKSPPPTYRTTSTYRAPAYQPSYRPSYRASYSRR